MRLSCLTDNKIQFEFTTSEKGSKHFCSHCNAPHTLEKTNYARNSNFEIPRQSAEECLTRCDMRLLSAESLQDFPHAPIPSLSTSISLIRPVPREEKIEPN
jgi:hypothetical protein